MDVVVVMAEYGNGKRAGKLSDFTFAVLDTNDDKLLTIGKAYSGLSDSEIDELTIELKSIAPEKMMDTEYGLSQKLFWKCLLIVFKEVKGIKVDMP